MEYMDAIINDIKKLMSSVEVFLKSVSNRYETLETRIEFERYKNAYFKTDRFESYRSFDPELLLQWGITNKPSEAYEWAEDPSKIPIGLRQEVLLRQRQHIVDNYVEKNEYIRTRLGLPSLEEMDKKEFIYASDNFYQTYGISKKPVHELSDEHVALLKDSGELKRLMQENPRKRYLKYLGTDRLDLFEMKSASNFQLMRFDETLDRKLLSEFTFLYEQCRTYMVNVTYVKDFSNRYEHYDGFMGMMILIMTIQRLIVNTFRVGIERDFYDVYNLKALFESYNVPFIEELPLEYQRLLARNLNRLLKYKSTDRVVYDLAELLGFNEAQFFKYFLVKQHRYDENGEPIFVKKTITDIDGTEKEVYDYEKMYDIYFQGVAMNEENESLALTDITNRVSYEDMVLDDPYWWGEDDELRRVLYESEFNIIESKYIGVQVMYRLTKMIHEVATVFRMIIDNQNFTKDVGVFLPKLRSDRRTSLLEAIMVAICLICKRNNATGEIITTPSKTLSVLGFNFKADFELILQYIDEKKDLIEHERIVNLLRHKKMDSVKSINELYGNIKELWNFLIDKMSRAQTLEEYEAYYKLYKTLYTTQDVSEVFRKSNGEIAETYFDYLKDISEDLYFIVTQATEEEIIELLEHIIYGLESEMSNVEYLHILSEGSDLLVSALKQLVSFFKSYTIDLKELSVIYILDNRHYNMMRIISHLKSIQSNITGGHFVDIGHHINTLAELIHSFKTNFGFRNEMEVRYLLKNLSNIKEQISVVSNSIVGSVIDMVNDTHIQVETLIQENHNIQEEFSIMKEDEVREVLNNVNKLIKMVEIVAGDRMDIGETIQEIQNRIEQILTLDLQEVNSITKKYEVREILNSVNKLIKMVEMIVGDRIDFVGTVNEIQSRIESILPLTLSEEYLITKKDDVYEVLNSVDKVIKMIEIVAGDRMDIGETIQEIQSRIESILPLTLSEEYLITKKYEVYEVLNNLNKVIKMIEMVIGDRINVVEIIHGVQNKIEFIMPTILSDVSNSFSTEELNNYELRLRHLIEYLSSLSEGDYIDFSSTIKKEKHIKLEDSSPIISHHQLLIIREM